MRPKLTLVVSHIKPALDPGPGPRERIARQVADLNDLGMSLVVARQGQRIEF
jgi:hypothetical protein